MVLLLKKSKLKNVKKLYYIIDKANWSNRWDGYYITKNISSQFNLKAKTTSKIFYIFKKNNIIHFGYPALFFKYKNLKNIVKKHNIITTFFHINEIYENLIKRNVQIINENKFIHTSSSLTQEKLIKLGVLENKVIKIPLGVDTKIFRKYNVTQKLELKRKYGIPDKHIVIGSFQKDGAGWGKGMEPKLIKGPDIFCDVVHKLSKEINVFVLLSGPARGYVIKRLEKMGIKYKHIFLKNYLEIVNLYNIIDIYIVTSRIEGGPKSLLESWATGVPLVTTKVGMAPDIINSGINGVLCDVENVEQIYNSVLKIINDSNFRDKLIKNGIKDVAKYDWLSIANLYYDKMYKYLIK